MLIDARQLPSGTICHADLCIVGAGPAGITLARTMRGHGIKVLLVEQGDAPGRPLGVGPSATTAGDDTDFEAPPSVPPRFGGGANEWIVRLRWMARGVRMVPLQQIDVERREWVPHSGWPIAWEELERYLRRAHEQLRLGDWGYSPADWADAQNPALDLEAAGFTSAIERFARPSVFTRDAWRELREAPDVHVLLNAPVGALDGSVDRVDQVHIDDGQPGRLTIEAKVYVLACGGVLNPTLLLAARNGAGIGAGGPAVGAYYMDHLRFISGVLTPSEPALVERLGLYDIRTSPRGIVMAKLTPTAHLQRDHALLNSAAMLLPRPSPDVQRALGQVRDAANDLRGRRRPDSWPRPGDVARALGYLVATVPEMAVRQRRFPPRTDAGWSSTSRNSRRYPSLAVEHQVEQAPDPSNRLVLSGRRDAHGRLTTTLTWRWGELDLRSARATQQLFSDATARTRIGRFEPTRWDEHPELTTPGGAFHPTGATRMSTTPNAGVVDADGRVHGVTNLYVTGSSVFPTSGYANPTLTLIALAIRLGERLVDELAQPVPVTP